MDISFMVLMKAIMLLLVLTYWGEANAFVSRLGEMKTPSFYGSHIPDFEYNPYSFRFNFIENEMKSNYVERNINDEFIHLSEYISGEFYQGLNCPDESYSEKNSYIKFLVRLQTMSYLFQSLRKHEYAMDQLGVKNTCALDWMEVIKSCAPQTSEMKYFTKNSALAFKNLSEVKANFKPKLENFKKKWIRDINNSKGISLTQVQIQKSLLKGEKVHFKELAARVGSICEKEKNLFLSLCHEKDQLYGLSNISEVYSLLVSSNGLRGINKDRNAAGCVKRFIKQNKNLERSVPFLADMYAILYDYNSSHSPANPQGRLFNIGAAKEFMDKGLTEVFKPQVKKKVVKEEIKVVARLSNPKFDKIVLPEFKKKKKKKRKSIKRKKKEVKKVRKSSFLTSCEIREEGDLVSVDIDMEKFRLDYTFTLTEKQKILPVVKKYSSVSALKSMKKLDRLGSREAPMPLKFLKFLIDGNLNQNLFNMNLVLGEELFVINDIDPNIKSSNLIRLYFRSGSSNGWRISVLRD